VKTPHRVHISRVGNASTTMGRGYATLFSSFHTDSYARGYTTGHLIVAPHVSKGTIPYVVGLTTDITALDCVTAPPPKSITTGTSMFAVVPGVNPVGTTTLN
jgi:hypothetical protein